MIRNKDVPITPENATLADLDLNLNDPTNPNMFFYPKEDTLKILCCYLYEKCVRKGGS